MTIRVKGSEFIQKIREKCKMSTQTRTGWLIKTEIVIHNVIRKQDFPLKQGIIWITSSMFPRTMCLSN